MYNLYIGGIYMNDRNSFLKSIKYNPNNNNLEHYTAKKGSLNECQRNKKHLKNGIIAALVGVTILGATACSKEETKQTTTPPTTTIAEQSTTDKSDELSDLNKLIQDFKERYIRDYNKEHHTSILSADITLNLATPDYLLEVKNSSTGNSAVSTHGSNPEKTKNILDSYGTIKVINR
jgi:hypothetical protein